MTKQRLLIADVLKSSSGHMTAEEIYIALKNQGHNMAIGTVYRNLGLMVKDKEILHIPVTDGPDRYDKTKFAHDHLICSCCNKLFDADLGDLSAYIEQKTGYKIDSYTLTANFVCPECSKKTDE